MATVGGPVVRQLGFGVLLGAVMLAALSWSPVRRWWKAGVMLTALSTAQAAPPPPSERPDPDRLIEEHVSVPGRDGPIRARIYRRADQPHGRGLVIAHGIHHEGMNERRMVPFARELARAGRVVLTPELADLADYRITRQGVAVIRDAALYLGARPDIVSEARVGLLGFSFAGGLALVAAAEPELAGRVELVASVGGHHDLGRVLRFLIRNQVETPAGAVRKQAHDYGLVVVLYDAVDRVAPEADRVVLRDALRASLHGDAAGARTRAAALRTDDGRRLWRLVETQRLQELAPVFETIVREGADELARLSPAGRLADIGVPVYVVHGAGDSVIPSAETDWAARELGDAPHVALVTPLIEHVEVNGSAGIGDKLALLRFIANIL
jgi:dienelactone hydrolase